MDDFFEVGYYYRLKTFRTRSSFFNYDGLMDYMLDGRWHKCIKSQGDSNANFEEDLNSEYRCIWYWPMSYILDMEKSENPFIEDKQFLLEL